MYNSTKQAKVSGSGARSPRKLDLRNAPEKSLAALLKLPPPLSFSRVSLPTELGSSVSKRALSPQSKMSTTVKDSKLGPLRLKPARKTEPKLVGDVKRQNFSSELLRLAKGKKPGSGTHEGGSVRGASVVRTSESRARSVGAEEEERGSLDFLFACRSRAGFSLDQPKKSNQDAFFARPNCVAGEEVSMFGVCDGHGAHGHRISAFIANNLPVLLEERLLSEFRSKKKPVGSREIKEMLMVCTRGALEELVNRLYAREDIDTQFSGSTLCLVILVGELVFAFNVGDSRAVHFSLERGRSLWHGSPLSEDHKPEVPSEAERILRFGGVIAPSVDDRKQPSGPPRVWLKGQPVPGLAMTRSLGDRIAEKVGVTWKPTFLYKRLRLFDSPRFDTSKCDSSTLNYSLKSRYRSEVQRPTFDSHSLKDSGLATQKPLKKLLNSSLETKRGPIDAQETHIIVLATDGLWDVMLNHEVSQCLAKFQPSGQVEEACDKLMAETLKRWKKGNFDSTDDVTFIVIFPFAA